MMYFCRLSLALALLAAYPVHSISVSDENEGTPYGVDCSFPIHHKVSAVLDKHHELVYRVVWSRGRWFMTTLKVTQETIY
jgi:hypothetical protein